MKYFICIFKDNKNKTMATNDLFKVLEFYAENTPRKTK